MIFPHVIWQPKTSREVTSENFIWTDMIPPWPQKIEGQGQETFDVLLYCLLSSLLSPFLYIFLLGLICFFFIVLIKCNDQKQLGGILQSYNPQARDLNIREAKELRQGPGGRNQSKDLRGISLTVLLLMTCSPCFLIYPDTPAQDGTDHSGLGLPTLTLI